MYDCIIYEIKDMVGIISLNRSEHLNTINLTMRDELVDCISVSKENPEIRVLIIRGTQELFGAGVDLKELGGAAGDNSILNAYNTSASMQEMCNDIEAFPKPTIAVIAGHCLGGALEIALACDIRIVSENAKVGLPELKLGIVPGAGGSQRLPRIIGSGPAKELLFTGERISGAEAYRIGLANHITTKDNLFDFAMALAGKIAGNAPLAVAQAKLLLDCSLDSGSDKGMILERAANEILANTEDRAEGRKAFLEKRDPQFKGQ